MNGKQPPTKLLRPARRPLRSVADLARSTLCVLCLMAYSSIAGAVSDEERAGARAAANAGVDAFAEQRWEDAIGYFQKAESLVHAPTHLLNIARAHEKLGQLVEAREAYMKVVREELAADAPKAFHKAQTDARSELAALEPRVPRVSVVVQGAGDFPVRVHMNGSPVPDGLVGVPRPLNPGSYEFQAFAEGAKSNPSTLVLREGAAETMVLTLKATTTPPLAAAAVPSAAMSTESPKEQQDTGQSAGGVSGMRIASYVSMGVGVVGLGVGTVFAVKSANKSSEADGICSFTGAYTCPTSARAQVEQLDSEADKAKNISIIGFVAGGVGVATGVTLFVLSSKSGSKSASLMPWIGLNSAGVRGSF